ncbi:RNA polymerase sigma factor [Tepidiforma thermophila]|uniref:RNA polymerase sigma-70 factor (ECF subfamily) n=1 Tax=Tepidiforma thermophila (strain KCTC 52669 / CGMCC 1.13589 / G233) TaxID=2761530 RepID=A0A2A9HB35_TEPT2|nr:sigma-70 family RNA polymerase sigma factor [Tepidiforma thermophila]PFG72968.1 RNA polymerase sigma-70 factor (ECF subfamily) [Tepidiforma thermophila]
MAGLAWPMGAIALALAADFGGIEAADGPGRAEPGLIERLRRREPGAWRELFEREMPAIYRYAYSRVASASDAEDLAALVFEQAWRSAEHLQDRGLPARAWLFGIARHVVTEHRRRLFRAPPVVALEAFDGADPGLEGHDEQVALAKAVASLPRADAEVVTLRFLHGLSLAETAEAMGATVDAVKSRQTRALRKLRELLGDPGGRRQAC